MPRLYVCCQTAAIITLHAELKTFHRELTWERWEGLLHCSAADLWGLWCSLSSADRKHAVSFKQQAAGVWRVNKHGCTHVDFGRLCESSYRMDVVVQDDDPDHHPQAEGHRVLAGESAAVLPERTRSGEIRRVHVRRKRWKRWQEVTHGVSNMTLHTVAIVLKQSVVFSMGRFLFWKKNQRWDDAFASQTLTLHWRLLAALPRTRTSSCRHLMFSAWAWHRRRTEISDWPVHCWLHSRPPPGDH